MQESMQASKHANGRASGHTRKQASKQASKRRRNLYCTHHDVMFSATSWYPYPTHTRREPCAAPVHCIERDSSAAQRQCIELIVAKYGTDWSSSRGPRNGRMLAIRPIRLVALTKCAVRPLNFRCGLFHPPPSCKRTPSRDIY